MTKKQEAKMVLGLLGMPAEQQSDICCYSLLALLKLSSSSSWSAASSEWTRIHDILAFLRKNYRGARYAENSRETFRKQAMHHFRTAAIIEDNGVATNSPNDRYRVTSCRNLAGCTSDMHRIRLEDGRRRRLSVREAARLQSFPDGYEFSGTKEQQFTMIGNAVPPMFSYKLAHSVIGYLKRRESHSDKHSVLADLAKRAVDPAVKAASLAMLVKAGGAI